MSEINLPPFYVGQKVVALATSYSRDGLQIIKDNIYTVADLKKCRCGKWIVLVRELLLSNPKEWVMCCETDGETPFAGGNAKYFAPIYHNFQSITLEKVLEEETKLISVN